MGDPGAGGSSRKAGFKRLNRSRYRTFEDSLAYCSRGSRSGLYKRTGRYFTRTSCILSQDAGPSKEGSGQGRRDETMRLKIRSTLLFAIVALMACSLSAVSAVVLFRHLAVVQTVADREIEQAASDVAHRVSRFLENGPAVLNRVKYFIEPTKVATMG